MARAIEKYFEPSNSARSLIFWTAFAAVGFALAIMFYYSNPAAYIRFASKARLAENIQAFFYFASGLIFLFLAFRQPWREGRSRFLLLPFLLGLLYLGVCGEEISWGQDFLRYDTPAFLGSNLEGESNIHNLPMFDGAESVITQDRLMHAFVILYGILMPLAYRFIPWVRQFLNKIYCPVVPLATVPFFVLGMLHRQTIGMTNPHYTHAEVKELFFTTGFILAAISALRGTNRIAAEEPAVARKAA